MRKYAYLYKVDVINDIQPTGNDRKRESNPKLIGT